MGFPWGFKSPSRHHEKVLALSCCGTSTSLQAFARWAAIRVWLQVFMPGGCDNSLPMVAGVETPVTKGFLQPEPSVP